MIAAMRLTGIGMMGKDAQALAALLAAGLLLAGCSFGRINSRDFAQPGAALPAGSTVAVLPFENLTNHPNAGQIAADIVSTELYGVEGIRTVEVGRVRSRLSAAKPAADAATPTASANDGQPDAAPLDAQAAGRALGVDAVLAGSVSEYGYQHGLREEPVVGLNARLVRTSDGAVLWTSSQSEAGRGYFSRDSVNNVTQRVVARMIDSLRPAIAAPIPSVTSSGGAPAGRAPAADYSNDLPRE